MEEKRIKNCCSIWSFFKYIFINKISLSHAINKVNSFKYLGKNESLRSLGFTLIELLIVIGLIGVLAASFIIIIDPAKQLKKARDSHRMSDLEQIRSALELYRADCGNYPDEDPGMENSLPLSLTGNCTATDIIYLKNVPLDPKFKTRYWYDVNEGGYVLVGCLENNYLNDDDDNTESNATCSVGSGWGGFSYNLKNP